MHPDFSNPRAAFFALVDARNNTLLVRGDVRAHDERFRDKERDFRYRIKTRRPATDLSAGAILSRKNVSR